MKRKLILALVVVLSFTGGAVSYGAVKAVNGTYDGFPIVKVFSGGKELTPTGVPAIVHKGTTLVPIALLRQLGVDVKWDQATYSVEVSLPPPRVVPVLTKSQLEELAKSVYLIYAYTKDGKVASQGSGFIVDGLLITNAHVAADYAYIQVQIDGKWQKIETPVFVDKDIDLMGFKVNGGKSLPISTKLPEKGDPVYDISYPGGELAITEGEVHFVSTTQLPTGTETKIVHSAKIDDGSSGGVVLNGRGEVIGINRAGGVMLSDGEYYSQAIPTFYLAEKLNK